VAAAAPKIRSKQPDDQAGVKTDEQVGAQVDDPADDQVGQRRSDGGSLYFWDS
jgi:hypothetical protein